MPYAAFWDVHFLSPCVGAFDPSHDHVLWLRGLGQPGTSKGWEDCHGMVGLLRVHRVGLPGIDWLGLTGWLVWSAFWKEDPWEDGMGEVHEMDDIERQGD